MICRECGGLVFWQGKITELTHTKCEDCGGINCQETDDEPSENDDPSPLYLDPDRLLEDQHERRRVERFFSGGEE